MNSIIVSAVTAAAWVSVTPQTITKHVPEYVYSYGSAGSVQSADYLKAKPVQTCPIIENGRVVGFSVNCGGK